MSTAYQPCTFCSTREAAAPEIPAHPYYIIWGAWAVVFIVLAACVFRFLRGSKTDAQKRAADRLRALADEHAQLGDVATVPADFTPAPRADVRSARDALAGNPNVIVTRLHSSRVNSQRKV